MRVMVLGSIGYGGVDQIRKTYSLLRREGFDVLNHVEAGEMDYSKVKDFRKKKELSDRIVDHDLKFLDKSDVIVVLSNGPSYGTGVEMFQAKRAGKRVILLAKKPVPTPWPVKFSDRIVTSERELIQVLRDLERR